MSKSHASCAALAVLLAAATLISHGAAPKSIDDQRKRAHKLQADGNWKEAHEAYVALLETEGNAGTAAADDFQRGWQCLTNLNQPKLLGEYVEEIIASEAHSENWRVLRHAGRYFALQMPHWGYVVDGEFVRGNHRGGGRYVSVIERDRVRGLQIMMRGYRAPVENDEAAKAERAQFISEFASIVGSTRSRHESWRLQNLTNLDELPDWEDGGRYGARDVGTPVDANGKPLYYGIPDSWEKAKNDGERWRFLLTELAEFGPNYADSTKNQWASFLLSQFGVNTLQRGYSGFFGRGSHRIREDDTKKDESGIYELHTLRDGETICRLATGVKRIKLPDEHNPLLLFQQIGAGQSAQAESALQQVSQIFENRRQYSKAGAVWRENIKRFGAGNNRWKENRLHQIIKNWGRFDGTHTHPAGEKPTLGFVFRNAKSVEFEAHAVDVPALLADIQKYLESNPLQLDGHRTNLNNIGYELVNAHWKRYVGERVAKWQLDLEPRPNHWDRRIDISAPIQKAGAYLVRAKMADGNTSHILLWLADTAIVKKPLSQQGYYFVADSATGKPLAGAQLDFFGYRVHYRKKLLQPQRRFDVITKKFTAQADADGQVFLKPEQASRQMQWLVTARGENGRFGFHGFSGVWYNNRHDAEYKQIKTLFVTDRPVYRPGQEVEFKAWVRHAQYDQEDNSQFAGKQFTLRIHNPKGEKILEKRLKADAFGGISGTMPLPEEAALGIYRMSVQGGGNHGGQTFRVEEYKKPEFEVIVEAPDEPVMLGEKVPAKITAKYLFGAPVQDATVKFKVMRSEHNSRWYAPRHWDWFYGTGYWWHCYDYDWYPGWAQWGCRAPLHWWWPRNNMPPEIVLENEVQIGPDGTVEIEIDTALAKAMHSDIDHKYSITAEVRDASRRTIVGSGNVLVARKPFAVNVWVDRGYFRVGDAIQAKACARTLDGKPVAGKGVLTLFQISYDEDGKPLEKPISKWQIAPDAEGCINQQLKASAKGQYRLSYTLEDAKGHRIEGGYVFVVRGDGFDGKEFRFNDLEIITDKGEYAPGETMKLMINTERTGSTVALFVRPSNGVYLPPRIVRLAGKSTLAEIEIGKKDMPNFFVEAFTVSGGKIYEETREVIVPPEKRVLNVEVLPSEERYKPGAPAKVKVRLTDMDGEPFVGTTVLSVYDKAVEYISGGSNVPDIREFFWKWRRHHRRTTESNLTRNYGNIATGTPMGYLGIFGAMVADFSGRGAPRELQTLHKSARAARPEGSALLGAAAAPAKEADAVGGFGQGAAQNGAKAGGGGAAQEVQPAVRSNFADTAFWRATLDTGKDGTAEIELEMPENLTTWKIKTWGMGHGTIVGQGEAEVITSKDLIIRLQAPRFFVEKDEVVLSANVHNYLDSAKDVRVVLEIDGKTLKSMQPSKLEQRVRIDAGGEHRIDWRVGAIREGETVITMKALTDEESDAMQMSFPVFVHGMLKTESFSGAIRPDGKTASLKFEVPAERRAEQSRLEIRYSPSLATAMVDALPYLVDYPYGCTEQTLNRFVPTAITQKILIDMGLDLEEIRKKRTNLNAQEIGDDRERAKQWKRWKRNPVFDTAEVDRMVAKGVRRLTNMQNGDGGWGWFYAPQQRSWPHTTAVVLHGLQTARDNDVKIPQGVIQRGVQWLKSHQDEQIRRLENWGKDNRQPKKRFADAMDAFVFMVLCDEKVVDAKMRDFLYRDRNQLAVYAKSLVGLAMNRIGEIEKRDMLIRNIEQFLVIDEENQSAYLELGNGGYWWYWYGSEFEAHAYYLKLLAVAKPQSPQASGLAKYLINNRKHATYWNSTRDTAICVEALADYIRAAKEDRPEMTVEILLDGKKLKEVEIDRDNLFTFDNKLVLEGEQIKTGAHQLEIRRKGTGAVYFNAYLTNFTLEDFITKAGLEVKVQRKYYKLVREEKTVDNVTQTGGSVAQRVEKYRREAIASGDTIKSGDLVEIELIIESKNDYEYLMFEDMKPAGFEPVEVRSGYGGNDMGAYMELRDERVAFFVRALARGKHSLSYRMRAETPGKFSALPAKGEAMYAPELKANSDELKIGVID